MIEPAVAVKLARRHTRAFLFGLVVSSGSMTALASEPITAPGPHGALAGTFTQPAMAAPGAPVALILPGSGPVDRNGDVPGSSRGAYRQLADALAAQGVATIRIDKRGLGGSAAAGDGNAVTLDDYVTDTRAWMASLRRRSAAPCVWLIGHSEGGLIALATAQSSTGLCGIVLLESPGRNLADVLMDQLEANPANSILLDRARDILRQLRAGHRVDVAHDHPALGQGLFRPVVQGLWISELAVDPAELLRKIALPVLIVLGGRDRQITMTDASRLRDADPSAALWRAPEMGHDLFDVAGPHAAASAPTTSLTSGLTSGLAPGLTSGLAETIGRFIAAHRSASTSGGR